MLSKEEILNRMGNKGMFEVYLHGDWSKVDSKIGINIKNAWSRESKSHGECELIVLSKTVYVEWDHLIHRKRSPFPYEGKALTPLNGSETYNAGLASARPRANAPLHERRRGEALRRPPLCGGGVGWRGSPLRTIYGADSGFRRTACIPPRRA